MLNKNMKFSNSYLGDACEPIEYLNQEDYGACAFLAVLELFRKTPGLFSRLLQVEAEFAETIGSAKRCKNGACEVICPKIPKTIRNRYSEISNGDDPVEQVDPKTGTGVNPIFLIQTLLKNENKLYIPIPSIFSGSKIMYDYPFTTTKEFAEQSNEFSDCQ